MSLRPILGLVASAFLVMGSTASHSNFLVRIKAASPEQVAAMLTEKGFDVAGQNHKASTLEVVTAVPEDLEALADGSATMPDQAFAVLSVEPTQPYQRVVAASAAANDATTVDAYPNTDQTYQKLRDMAAANPTVAQVVNLNEWLNLPLSAEGRPLMALRVGTDPSLKTNKIKTLYIGEHHARELMTHQAVLDIADNLLKELASGTPIYTDWIKDTDVWFVPVVNPDGLAHVFTGDRWWRKNRANNADGSRGVDLNRNYPFKWGTCGATSTQGASDTFRGASAGSEPESKTMDRLNSELHFQFAISFHSSGDEVLYPYLCGQMAEAPIYYSIMESLRTELGYGKRLASSSGEDFENHYARYGTIAFLLEVGDEFQPEFATYRNHVWPSVAKTLPFMLKEVHKPYLTINVQDGTSRAPLKGAKVALDKIVFKEGEVRETDGYGTYRWRVLPETYQLTVTAAGYRNETRTVTVRTNVAETVTVEMSAN